MGEIKEYFDISGTHGWKKFFRLILWVIVVGLLMAILGTSFYHGYRWGNRWYRKLDARWNKKPSRSPACKHHGKRLGTSVAISSTDSRDLGSTQWSASHSVNTFSSTPSSRAVSSTLSTTSLFKHRKPKKSGRKRQARPNKRTMTKKSSKKRPKNKSPAPKPSKKKAPKKKDRKATLKTATKGTIKSHSASNNKPKPQKDEWSEWLKSISSKPSPEPQSQKEPSKRSSTKRKRRSTGSSHSHARSF